MSPKAVQGRERRQSLRRTSHGGSNQSTVPRKTSSGSAGGGGIHGADILFQGPHSFAPYVSTNFHPPKSFNGLRAAKFP